MYNNVWILLGLAMLSLCSLSPVPIRIWAWQDNQFKSASFPASSLAPASLPLAGDLEGDGSQERLLLVSDSLAILKGNQTLWRSPLGWQVIQAGITDLNHDGQLEVTLLVWRPYAPWPIDRYIPSPGRIATFHDSNNQSCHIILIGWKGKSFGELWAGSALAEPVQSFQVANVGANDKQVLVTLDSLYSLERDAPALTLSAWEWNGFGFSLLTRLQGPFTHTVLLSRLDSTSQLYFLTSRR